MGLLWSDAPDILLQDPTADTITADPIAVDPQKEVGALISMLISMVLHASTSVSASRAIFGCDFKMALKPSPSERHVESGFGRMP